MSSITAAAVLSWCTGAGAQIRIAAYNTATAFETNGTPRPGLQTVLQGMGNESVNGVAKRVDLLFLTEQNNSTGTSTSQILSMMNNLYGAGTYAKSALIAGASVLPSIDSPALVYDTTKFSLINEVAVGTVSGSGMPRQEIRYQLRPVGYGANSDFYVYTVHYKANGDSTSINRRNIEAQAMRANANTLPAGSRILYVGDFNLTEGTSEPAWGTITAPGNGQGIDPANGSWANVNQTWATDGLGSRLDFQFQTAPTNDGQGFSLINGSYHGFGNNGSIGAGSAANSASNTALPGLPNRTATLNAIVSASDHYADIADYRYPAKMSVSVGSAPTQVIVGANAGVNVAVTNTAPVQNAIGADGLSYTVTASGSLSGGGSGTSLLALSPANNHTVNVNTATPGLRSGTISVTSSSQEVASGTFTQAVSVQVLDHAQPSFSDVAGASVATIDFAVRGRGLGGATSSFAIHNLIGAGMTAGLDLDSIVGAGSTGALTTSAATFTNLSASSSTSFVAEIHATNNGTFSATYTFNLSDQDLPGAIARGPLTLVLTGIIATPGDADLNGAINFDDYAHIDSGFSNTLTGWANGDFDSNGQINFDDYALIDLNFTQGGGNLLARAMSYLDGTDRSARGMEGAALQMVSLHFDQFGGEYAGSFLNAVPEPSGVMLFGLPTFVALFSRRKARSAPGR